MTWFYIILYKVANLATWTFSTHRKQIYDLFSFPSYYSSHFSIRWPPKVWGFFQQVCRLNLWKLMCCTFTVSQYIFHFTIVMCIRHNSQFPQLKGVHDTHHFWWNWVQGKVLPPWRLMQGIPPKCWCHPSRLHRIITHNMKVRACSPPHHGSCEIWIRSQYFSISFHI
jgi:hypothetical protein